MIPVNCEEKQQFEQLVTAFSDMKLYLERLEQGCAQIVEIFYENKAVALDNLTQIIEGLGYCSKLIQSAIPLLALDAGMEEAFVAPFNDGLSEFLKNLDQAAMNEDYSLLADLVEYDLTTVIHSAQKLLKKLLQYCLEGKV